MGDDCADIAGEEVFMGADAENERAAATGSNDEARNVSVDDGDAVGADDLAQRETDRLDEASLVAFSGTVEFVADEVGENFGIGLRDKGVSAFDQVLAECLIVLDNAVVDEREASTLVRVGMGIFGGDPAMRGPAGMADACLAVDRVLLDDLRQIRDASDRFSDLDRSAIEDGDSRRVISAVFQAAQSVEKHRKRLRTADIANDSTHRFEP